jgi:hypothetical protein
VSLHHAKPTIRYAAFSVYPHHAETTANLTHVANVKIQAIFNTILIDRCGRKLDIINAGWGSNDTDEFMACRKYKPGASEKLGTFT